ncbi:putative zinc-type alcohol dehydrogenase-like protein [Actinomycetospora succinea]|uniref:alcohol dehydrogenase (NADP(+)) n=1 Tax=Actinomycetospora succinea TaxID=663603 RepID=A0A4R6VRE1_9PSEU|nr:NAD(P)-dependent alcohol dehydrogenase [Actinomycetospora succinea]TDQ65030.1 putative zinc-type alcohol dehydrogenase-like protein [Actinomycetospora succinea]
MRQVTGWAADAPGAAPAPWGFERRDPRGGDVVVRVTHCGVCATDRHALAAGDPAAFPLVAGHEMTGVVEALGADVDDLAVGDRVAVGNIIDSCRTCRSCRAGRENDCEAFPTLTYGGEDRVSGGITQGGFSTEIVVDRHFVYALPAGLDPAGAAPLLCAGITTWAPLRRFGAGPGTTVGVVGVGGLGHLAIKFAHALGAETVALTTSEAKADAAKALGADDVVLTRDPDALARQARRFGLLLDTTGHPLDLAPYLGALAVDGTYVLAGIPPEGLRIDPMSLVVGEKRIAGTGSGGVPATREMLDVAAEHGIVADVEVVGPDRLPEALARLGQGDVRFRFVVEIARR